jgi:dCMP deaminase
MKLSDKQRKWAILVDDKISPNVKTYLLNLLDKKNVEQVNTPSWDEYFMSMAILASTRSPDAQWQVGSVIVNADKHIIGVGYNGFPRGLPDDIIPNVRPHKYKWILHSERNALSNCTASAKGATLYTNGKPCLECLKACYQSGITDFVTTTGKAHMLSNIDEEEENVYESFVLFTDIKIRQIEIEEVCFQKALGILEKSG